jgi:hypothetical protein
MKIKFAVGWVATAAYFGRVLLKFWRITLAQILVQVGTEVTG